MNKHSKIFVLSSIVITVLILLSIQKVGAETLVETTGATQIDATINSAPNTNPANLRDKIKADLDEKMQNAKINQEFRKQILEKNKPAPTSTKQPLPLKRPQDQRENQYYYKINQDTPNKNRDQYYYRNEKAPEKEMENRPSSTTPKFRRDGYENKGDEMAAKLLREKKDSVHKQLNVAMQNLVELRKRISSRIEKDKINGKDLSAVSELLKIADSKIALAKESVTKLRSYEPVPNNTSNVGTTTATVNLNQVRKLIDDAQRAIKEAHKSLTDVVVAIAKISGDNKSKPSPLNTTPPSPTTTSTTN